jgi:hypothetical protein
MGPKRKALYQLQTSLDKTKAIKAIQNYSGKILIVEHENDELVPQRIPEVYFDNILNTKLKEKIMIPNAPHALHDPIFINQSIKILVDWFTKTL